MKQSEILFDETNIINKVKENDYKKRISKNNSNSCYLIIIGIILIIILVINLYQTIKIEKQNNILNNFSNVQNNLILNFFDHRKRNFLVKLMKKLIETKNIMLLYNYMELDYLFKDDKRYDGARNCLVQPEFNSSCLYYYLNTKKSKRKNS